MKRITLVALAFLTLALPFVFGNAPKVEAQSTKKTTPTQTTEKKVILGKTFLEGMALDEENEPLYKHEGALEIRIKDREGNTVLEYAGGFPNDLGGLYRYEIKPGAYDIFISTAGSSTRGKLRPLRLNGVMITGGMINKLDITMHRGEALEIIGEPIEPTLPAIIISKKLEEMQQKIDALEKQVAELKKK